MIHIAIAEKPLNTYLVLSNVNLTEAQLKELRETLESELLKKSLEYTNVFLTRFIEEFKTG